MGMGVGSAMRWNVGSGVGFAVGFGVGAGVGASVGLGVGVERTKLVFFGAVGVVILSAGGTAVGWVSA